MKDSLLIFNRAERRIKIYDDDYHYFGESIFHFFLWMFFCGFKLVLLNVLCFEILFDLVFAVFIFMFLNVLVYGVLFELDTKYRIHGKFISYRLWNEKALFSYFCIEFHSKISINHSYPPFCTPHTPLKKFPSTHKSLINYWL